MEQKNYRRILSNLIKWQSGLSLFILGIILISVAQIYLRSVTIFKGFDGKNVYLEGTSSLGSIISEIGSVLFSIGITIIIIEILFRRYQDSENEFLLNGIFNIYKNKKELQEKYSYKYLASKYDNIIFIGIRHEEFTDALASQKDLINEILSKSSNFKINLYFLSPVSKHVYLFEDEIGKVGINKEFLLPNNIINNINTLLTVLAKNEHIKSKVNIYIYDSVPIGNISFLDNELVIINRYNYFEPTQRTFWFAINKEAAQSQGLYNFFDKINENKPVLICSVTDLSPFRPQ